MILFDDIDKKFVEIKSLGYGVTVEFWHGLNREPKGVLFYKFKGDVEFDINQWTENKGMMVLHAPEGERIQFWVF